MKYYELDNDYLQMAHDYEEMERVALQDAETLRQLNNGERIVIPVDVEHARAMFKMASFYLQQHDTTFTLTHDGLKVT